MSFIKIKTNKTWNTAKECGVSRARNRDGLCDEVAVGMRHKGRPESRGLERIRIPWQLMSKSFSKGKQIVLAENVALPHRRGSVPAAEVDLVRAKNY